MINVHTIVLPWRSPPLTLNQRMHYMAEYRMQQELKRAAMLMARSLGIPHMEAVTAELVWMKGDNRKADPDNIAPTMKPLLDGLVAARILDGDDSDRVLRTSQKIILRRDAATDGARLILRLTDMSALAVKR